MVKAPRALASSLAVVLLAVVAAGCGGSSTSSKTTATTTTASTTTTSSARAGGTAATTAFQSCLTQHGVTLPGGAPGGRPPAGGQPPANGQSGNQPPTGTPRLTAAQQKAFAACQSTLPANQRGRLGRPPAGQSTPAVTKYTTCLRKHGVTFGKSNNQSAFAKASTACAKYAPKAGN